MPDTKLISKLPHCAALLILALLTLPAGAELDNLLAYGDVARGEISNRQFEIEYRFEAEEGDVISVSMESRDSDAFRYPSLLLLSEDFELLAATHARSQVRIFHDVRADGVYLLFATRRLARAGPGEGGFSLLLERVAQLPAGQARCESVSGDSQRHYAIRANSDFELAYRFEGGGFRPEVTVNAIDVESGKLESIAQLSGGRLEYGRIGLAVASDSPRLYILRLENSRRVSETEQADYRIGYALGGPPLNLEVAACAGE